MVIFNGVALSYSEIIDICTLLLTIVGLTLAGIGLNTWNYQLKGSYKFELAKETKIAISQMGRRIGELRSLLASSSFEYGYDENNEPIALEIKMIDAISKDSAKLSLLGDMREFEKRYDSFLEKLFECELVFPDSTHSPIMDFFLLTKRFRFEITQFVINTNEGLCFGRIKQYYEDYFWSDQLLKALPEAQNRSIEYLDQFMDNSFDKKIKRIWHNWIHASNNRKSKSKAGVIASR